MLACETQGRHRYYRLAGSHVAQAIEQLASISPTNTAKRKALSREAQQLRFARCCYDHLAGRLGVAVTQKLQERGFIFPVPEKKFGVTAAGRDWFAQIGLDVEALKPTQRGLARQCLDWTERTHHLAGPLGVQLLGGTVRDRMATTHQWIPRRSGNAEGQSCAEGAARTYAGTGNERPGALPAAAPLPWGAVMV